MSFKRALNAVLFLIGGIAWLFTFGFFLIVYFLSKKSYLAFVALLFTLTLLFFSGCAEPMPRVVFKEVKIPVVCPVQMPARPENSGDFESHKKLMLYFLECESLLKHCTKGANHEKE